MRKFLLLLLLTVFSLAASAAFASVTLTITPDSLDNAILYKPYSVTLTATLKDDEGNVIPTSLFEDYERTENEYVIAWHSFDSNEYPTGVEYDTYTGIVSGTPTESGTFNFVVYPNAVIKSSIIYYSDSKNYTMNVADSVTKSYTLNVIPKEFEKLPDGTGGTSYTATISVKGGTLYGTLPAGLTFNSTTGVISGKPTEACENRKLVIEAGETVKGYSLTIKGIAPKLPKISSINLTKSDYKITASGTQPITLTAYIDGKTMKKIFGSYGYDDGKDRDITVGYDELEALKYNAANISGMKI